MQRARTWLAGAALLLLCGTATARFAMWNRAPVKRLLANVLRALAEAPDDPHLLYLAGRTHAVAYAFGEEAASSAERNRDADEALPTFGRHRSELLRFDGRPDATRLGHLRDGNRLLARASELAQAPPVGEDGRARVRDDRPLLFLGLAWLLDDGSRFAAELGDAPDLGSPDPLSEEETVAIDERIDALGSDDAAARKLAYDALRGSFDLCWPRLLARREAPSVAVRTQVAALVRRWWQDRALTAYRRAFAVSREADLRLGMHETYTVSAEAGEAILRLLDAAEDDPDAAAEREAVREHLERLKERPMAITPVVFPIEGAAPLRDLLPDDRSARFDLSGDGVHLRWPWPSADTGLLVWAPDPAEPITSGRQLIGSRTWWIFWRDGYEPLAMLDDDGDGRLAGAELEGLGVWRDADGNGVSDPGEVQSAADSGIRWIATSATRTEEGVPANDAGVGLRDGTTRPTYDWTPTSLPDPPPRE